MTDTTAPAPTDAALWDAWRTAVDTTDPTQGNAALKFARAVLAKWGAPAPASGEPVAEVISHVDADGLPKHPLKLWGEYASKVENLEREAAGLRQRMRKYESSAPTKAFAALTYYRDQVCDEDGPTTKEFHRLLAEALSAPPAQEVRTPLSSKECRDMLEEVDHYNFAIDLIRAVEKHHGITAQKETP